LLDLPMPERFLSPDDLVLDRSGADGNIDPRGRRRTPEGRGRSDFSPRVIVDDHGVDLNGGVRIFQQSHPETVEIYDAKHKAACLLKARLEKNRVGGRSVRRWDKCGVRSNNGIGRVGAAGLKAQGAVHESDRPIELGRQNSRASRWPSQLAPPWVRPERLQEKLGWLREFREDLAEWRQWQTIMDVTVGFVEVKASMPRQRSS